MAGLLFPPASSSSYPFYPDTSPYSFPAPPDPCPFCQFRAADDYNLLFHIETEHPEDTPFVPDNAFAVDGSEELIYVLCPEHGCEELILLLDLQTHMNFHSAENTGMEQSVVQQQLPPAKRELRRREHGERNERKSERNERRGERSERRGEKGERTRREQKDGEERKHRGHHHNHHRIREHGSTRGDKNAKVSFIAPHRSPVRSGLKWFERAVLVFAPHNVAAVLPEQRRERRRSESRRPERSLRRSDSKRSSEGASLRRSDSKVRRSESPRRSASSQPSNRLAKVKRSSTSSSRAVAVKPIGTIKKLGKSDLGPYAHEPQMPGWLREQLERGGRTITVKKRDPRTRHFVIEVQIANEVPDLIPTISLLCARDSEVEKAYLCHPAVKHVGKQDPKEGGFCGYRNIQMMISYIQAAFPQDSHPFKGRIPTILKLQELIEDGWARGINSNARLETGGIRGTRKYIGTSEAQTLLTAVDLPSRARPFIKSAEGTLQTQNSLLSWVEEYFESGPFPIDHSPNKRRQKVTVTNKPPIYLQHSGHSMTIVGLEKWKDGSSSLLVFDPFFSPSEAMRRLAGRRIGSRVRPEMLLKVYRRKMNYLAKYKEFEVIVLEP